MVYGNINNPPPFYENWDDVHCLECCLRGVLDYFEPDNNFTWQDVDEISNKMPGKWSWPQFAVKNMFERGYDIIRISTTRNEDIMKLGARNFLIKSQGHEAAEISIQHSPPLGDIETVCTELVKNKDLKHIYKIPDSNDLKTLLDDGYLIISMVNVRALNKKEGYAGHSVLIYGMDDTFIYFHDSGLPSFEARKETIDFFVNCATSPKETNWYIIAYKKED